VIVAELFASLGLAPDEHSWRAGHELIENVNKALEALVVYEAAKKVGELVTSTEEAAIGAHRLAQSLGTTSSAIQELGFAASESGVSTDDLRVGFQHLSLEMANAKKTGTGPLIDGLATLGVSFESVKNKSPDQILDLLADRFSKLPDGMAKTGVAMQLFGRSGASLIPLLDRGGKTIDSMRQEAEELGVVIGDEATNGFFDLEESTKRLDGAMTGLKNQAVVALLPTINELADSLFTWVKANREVIASSIQETVAGVITVMHGLAEAVGVVVDLVQSALGGDSGAQAILIGIGAVVVAAVVPAFIAWATATLAATWPLLAIGAVVFSVALGVLELVKHWDDVKKAIGEAWQTLKDTGEAVLDWMADLPVIKQLLELMRWIKGTAGSFSTAHGEKEQEVQDKADAYQRAHGGSTVGAPFAGTPDEEKAFDRDVMPLDAGPASSYLAPIGGRGGDTHISVGSPNITIHAPTGDARDISAAVKSGISDWWDGTLRDAHAATGGADL
jgi:hypothetical protein